MDMASTIPTSSYIYIYYVYIYIFTYIQNAVQPNNLQVPGKSIEIWRLIWAVFKTRRPFLLVP